MPRGNATANAPVDAAVHRSTTVTIDEIVDAFNRATRPTAEDRFTIALGVAKSYFAVDSRGRPSLLIPVASGRAQIGRDIGGLSVSYDAGLRFQIGGREWESAAVELSCLDGALLRTFSALAIDVSSHVAGPELPSSRAVSDALGQWERLLRARHRLTPQEEIGLWGELWTLARMETPDAAVHAWQGPSHAVIDFLCGSIAIDCKTSTQRLHHCVSQEQLDRPCGDAAMYIVSLWIGCDPMGESLSELVSRLDALLSESTTFEAKLLEAGYSRLDSALYRQRFAVLEEPLVFAEAAVPRIRAADPGVSAIRFTVTLDEAKALDAKGAREVLRGPVTKSVQTSTAS